MKHYLQYPRHLAITNTMLVDASQRDRKVSTEDEMTILQEANTCLIPGTAYYHWKRPRMITDVTWELLVVPFSKQLIKKNFL